MNRWIATLLPLALACASRNTDTEFTLKLRHGGEDRTADVRLPENHDVTVPVGVVLNFHGYGSNARQHARYSGMHDAAAARGLVSVHPDGFGNSWNAEACCGDAQRANSDDVGLVDLILEKLAERVTVDPARIFALGLSNGGFFSYRLACERADKIAAIVVVAGANGMEQCAPSRPVPLLHLHGTDDTLVEYDEGESRFRGAERSVGEWAGRLGCADDVVETFNQGEVRCVTRSTACARGSEAMLCTIKGGGHTWPGAEDFPPLGHTTHDINATEQALDFFQRHPLR